MSDQWCDVHIDKRLLARLTPHATARGQTVSWVLHRILEAGLQVLEEEEIESNPEAYPVLKDGTILTPELADELADEAERGYNVNHLRERA